MHTSPVVLNLPTDLNHKNNTQMKHNTQAKADSGGDFVVSTPKISQDKWITDGAWISGLVGCIAVLLIALICQRYRWLDDGMSVFGMHIKGKLDIQMLCLFIASLSMCIAEIIRLALVSPGRFFSVAPALRNRKIGDIFLAVLWRYACYLLIFTLLVGFYRTAGEYGFQRSAPYYQAWFKMCDWLYTAFLWLGFPYVLLTYCFKFDQKKENNSYHRLVECAIIYMLRKLKVMDMEYPVDGKRLKKIAVGLLVRIFFIPLMTVFFTHHFPGLVKNLGYAIEWLPQKIASGEYDHATFNKDLTNILKPIIFTIDVTLAWCGYVLTSRWLDNETQSAEPTMLGWLVCLISYPPFQLAGLYFFIPSESLISNESNQYFITFFSVLMLSSFIIYTASTVVFGVRFSNLTHRGIIRTGPFALVRHPAYASKNFAWWIGIFPVVLFLFFQGRVSFGFVLAGTLGLAAQSYWYYLRAITEEKHLSIDPAYREYCEKVKYRFIPKLI